MNLKNEDLCNTLFDIGAVKIGKFKLKNGSLSPIYIDLRVLVSYPEILKQIAHRMNSLIDDLEFDRIAGIPYTAIPIATALSLEFRWAMIYPRKETKEYGTMGKIEGVYNAGEIVLPIDDLVTDGESKIEAIKPLENAGLKVNDIIVLVDREQGAEERLKKLGYTLHSVVKISELLDIILQCDRISPKDFKSIKKYFEDPKKWSDENEA